MNPAAFSIAVTFQQHDFEHCTDMQSEGVFSSLYLLQGADKDQWIQGTHAHTKWAPGPESTQEEGQEGVVHGVQLSEVMKRLLGAYSGSCMGRVYS